MWGSSANGVGGPLLLQGSVMVADFDPLGGPLEWKPREYWITKQHSLASAEAFFFQLGQC